MKGRRSNAKPATSRKKSYGTLQTRTFIVNDLGLPREPCPMIKIQSERTMTAWSTLVMSKNEEFSSTIQKSLKKIWISARRPINPLKSTGFVLWFKRTDPGINLLVSHFLEAETRILAAKSEIHLVKDCRKLKRNGSYLEETTIWLRRKRRKQGKTKSNSSVILYIYNIVINSKCYRKI